MIEPTVLFKPFGEDGPKIVLCGKKTGDWNPGCFQNEGDHYVNIGLYSRFNALAERYRFSSIAIPSPRDCNTKICTRKDLQIGIHNGVGSVVLERGAKADGMVLFRGSTGAITSADCPVIVAFCPASKTVIMAHGGCKSLIDIDHFLHGTPPRENSSVVDEIMEKAKEYGFSRIKIFITCGISGKNYSYGILAPFVRSRFSDECVVGEGIDLKKVIVKQFQKYGVVDVTADTIDTHDDRDNGGNLVWHSCRRGKNPKEKSERNLVLVVN